MKRNPHPKRALTLARSSMILASMSLLAVACGARSLDVGPQPSTGTESTGSASTTTTGSADAGMGGTGGMGSTGSTSSVGGTGGFGGTGTTGSVGGTGGTGTTGSVGGFGGTGTTGTTSGTGGIGGSGGGTTNPCVEPEHWTPLSGVPGFQYMRKTTWTASELYTWGDLHGNPPGSDPPTTGVGAVYHLATETWSLLSTQGTPSPRQNHIVGVAGNRFVVWGGQYGTTMLGDGGIYDPATDTWVPTSMVEAPSARVEATAVSTGTKLLVWGGRVLPTGPSLATGAILDPATNTWQPTKKTNGAPAGRRFHSAVWTGTRMIVWGGSGQTGSLATGGIYDPETDTWTLTTPAGAPSARAQHSAVWTGSRMIVWGGGSSGIFPSTGGMYDPATDSWTPMSTNGAPPGDRNPVLVWLGDRLLVLSYPAPAPTVAALYHPATDSWAPVTTAGSPLFDGTSGLFVTTGAAFGCSAMLWGDAYPPEGTLYTPPPL